MTKQQVALFEHGFKCYAWGVERECLRGPTAHDLKWIRRGWDASKEANDFLEEQLSTADATVYCSN